MFKRWIADRTTIFLMPMGCMQLLVMGMLENGYPGLFLPANQSNWAQGTSAQHWSRRLVGALRMGSALHGAP